VRESDDRHEIMERTSDAVIDQEDTEGASRWGWASLGCIQSRHVWLSFRGRDWRVFLEAPRHMWPRCQPYEASSGVKLQFTSDDFWVFMGVSGRFMGDLVVHSIVIANKPPDTQCCS